MPPDALSSGFMNWVNYLNVVAPAHQAAPWYANLDWGSVAECFTGLVAVFALILSYRAFRESQRAARASEHSVREARFFAIHDRILQKDAQAGRRLMHRYQNARRSWDWVFRHEVDDFDQITYSLGLFQTLAQYLKAGAIDRDRVEEMWFGAIRRSWPEIESYVKWRRQQPRSEKAWDDLLWLGGEAGAVVTIT
jgi:hypothetical protein